MGQGNKNRKPRDSTRNATPSLLEKIDVYSAQKGSKNSVSILGGTVRVLYWESILSDSVRASVTFTDAGNTLSTSKITRRGRRPTAKKVSAVEGLPIEGSEEVRLKFADNNGVTLNFGKTTNNSLYVNKIRNLPTGSETTDKTYMLDLAPLEWIKNDLGHTEVGKNMRGQVSDLAKRIFKDFLKTKKKLDIERTRNKEDYQGLNQKPIYCLNQLSTRAVSQDVRNTGETAGYFFWETSDSYHFKSIDTLMDQDYKIKILYNESSEGIPKGYQARALSMETDNKVNVQKKNERGAWSNHFTSIDPFSGTVTNIFNSAEAFTKGNEVKLAGEELPALNEAFSGGQADSDYTKKVFQLASTGQLNVGPIADQLKDSKLPNFDNAGVFNQAMMRYNQLFASEVTIVLPGDFSLHAGDSVVVDIPQTDITENKACGDEVDQRTSGKYLISDLCHYITAKDTYTKLVLIRDSFGRKVTSNKGDGQSSSNANKVMDSNFLSFIK